MYQKHKLPEPHSPLPWSNESDREDTTVRDRDCQAIVIFGVQYYGYWTPHDADAAFIIRACNAFHALVEALENIENDSGYIPATIWKLRNHALDLAYYGTEVTQGEAEEQEQ